MDPNEPSPDVGGDIRKQLIRASTRYITHNKFPQTHTHPHGSNRPQLVLSNYSSENVPRHALRFLIVLSGTALHSGCGTAHTGTVSVSGEEMPPRSSRRGPGRQLPVTLSSARMDSLTTASPSDAARTGARPRVGAIVRRVRRPPRGVTRRWRRDHLCDIAAMVESEPRRISRTILISSAPFSLFSARNVFSLRVVACRVMGPAFAMSMGPGRGPRAILADRWLASIPCC